MSIEAFVMSRCVGEMEGLSRVDFSRLEELDEEIGEAGIISGSSPRLFHGRSSPQVMVVNVLGRF